MSFETLMAVQRGDNIQLCLELTANMAKIGSKVAEFVFKSLYFIVMRNKLLQSQSSTS
jgi:hypothetical protein